MTTPQDADLSEELLKLISVYQLHVLRVVMSIQQHFGINDFLAASHRGEIPKRGTLDDRLETRYEFHGVGCRVQSDGAEIDFNFGPEVRFDGFDGWRLWIFAQSQPEEYPQFQRHEIVESVLGELVTDGVVVRPHWMPSPHLCYLAESVE